MSSADNVSVLLNNSWTMTTDISSMVPPEPTDLDKFAKAFLKPSAIIAIVVASCGIIFNTLNMIVLWHPKMRSAVNLLLSLMAASELLLLILHIPVVSIFNLNNIEDLPRFHTPNKQHAKFKYFYNNASLFLHMAATWLLITTACFRFIYVQFPIKSAKLCSYRRAVIAGGCTIGACLVLIIPNAMLYQVVSYPCTSYRGSTACELSENIYTVAIDVDKHGQRFAKKFSIFNFWFFAVFSKFIPAILLPIFTGFLIKVLHEANQRKKRLQNDIAKKSSQTQSNEHSQTARMLLAVLISFLVIELPHGLVVIYVAATNKSYIYDNLGEVIDLATITAFSLNLVLYSAMSRQYRTLFVKIFAKKVRTKLRFHAKYKKCSNNSHRLSPGSTAETCALSHAQDTTHSVLHHSPQEEEKTLMQGKQKLYV